MQWISCGYNRAFIAGWSILCRHVSMCCQSQLFCMNVDLSLQTDVGLVSHNCAPILCTWWHQLLCRCTFVILFLHIILNVPCVDSFVKNVYYLLVTSEVCNGCLCIMVECQCCDTSPNHAKHTVFDFMLVKQNFILWTVEYCTCIVSAFHYCCFPQHMIVSLESHHREPHPSLRKPPMDQDRLLASGWYFPGFAQYFNLSSALSHCWLFDKKDISLWTAVPLIHKGIKPR